MIEFNATICYDNLNNNSIRFMPLEQAYLLPATSWANHGFKKPLLPEGANNLAADSGGFVASRIWGDYRFAMAQYVDWLGTFNPKWAATMDYCCEPPLTGGDRSVIREKQDKTTANAYRTWETYKATTWKWTPTIQGWEVGDYIRHAQEMKPLIADMRSVYGMAFRVGIGTLCARKDTQTAQRVVNAVSEVLPDVKFHLWGVKLDVVRKYHLPSVVSCDSAVWHGIFKADKWAWRETGMTQREYIFKVGLPAYLAKFEDALVKPKQIAMF